MRVLHAKTATHSQFRDRIVALAVFLVAMDLVASVAVLFLERHATGSEITNLGDSAFWVSSQLLPISSSLNNPVSPAAGVIDVVLEA